MPSAQPRTPRQVIDQAIGDNLVGLWIAYGITVALVGCGCVTLICGLINKQEVVALAGGIASALFIPALNAARDIRKQNIAIRLMEVPLTAATTADQAMAALNEFFQDSLLVRRRGG